MPAFTKLVRIITEQDSSSIYTACQEILQAPKRNGTGLAGG
jgi:hypothetical protein